MNAESEKTNTIAGSAVRNASYFVGWELIWGLAVPCCLLQTILPAYLQYLNTPKVLIQSTFVVCSLMVVFMLWSGKCAHGVHRLRRCIQLWLASCAGWMLYGLAALAGYAYASRWVWIGLFSLMCVFVSAAGALAAPATEEILLQNLPVRRRGLVISLRLCALGLGSLIGIPFAIWLLTLLEAPGNYHFRFVIGAFLMGVSLLIIMPFRDHAASNGAIERITISADIQKLLANFNFRILLVFAALMVTAQGLAPLLLTYGGDHLNMKSKGDYFTAAWMVGTLLFGALVPLPADRFGFRIIGFFTAVMLMAAFLCPVVGGKNIWVLLIGYGLYGASVILSFFVLPNLGAEIVSDVRPAMIFALVFVLTVPISLVIAPLAGLLVDIMGYAGYLGVFMMGATFCLCSAIGFAFILREPRTGQELYIRMRRM